MEKRILNLRYKRRTAVLAAMAAVLTLAFGSILFANLFSLRQAWVDYSYQTSQRGDALARIHRAVGYGGFIHNFKNYVLRQTPDYRQRLERDIRETRSALTAYAELELNGAESQALERIRQTFNAYLQALEIARLGIEAGLSPAPLDRRVVVSDRLATDALVILQREYEVFHQHHRMHVLERTDFLINMLLAGLLLLPLIGYVAIRHMGVLDRLAQSVLAKQEMQQQLHARTEEMDQVQKRSDQYRTLAYQCSLTRIANRQAFMEAVTTALQAAQECEQQLGVLYIDVDDFKRINDEYGHEVGDQVLTEIAARLEQVTGKEDLVARIGGDEFAVLVYDPARHGDKDQMVQPILTSLRQPFDGIVDGLQVSCSVGGALAPDHGNELGELMRAADQRMYAIKRSGKDGAMLG